MVIGKELREITARNAINFPFDSSFINANFDSLTH